MIMFPKVVRYVGLIQLPALLLLADYFGDFSRRQFILFLSSFSFQTSLLGWLYLLTRNPVLGQFSARYLSFVALVWMSLLGGLESSAVERIFNDFLHYSIPLCVLFYHHNDRAAHLPGMRYWLLGLLYPLGYLIFMLLINQWIGYELYPVLSAHPMLVAAIFAMVEAVHWNTNNLITMGQLNKP